MASYSDGSPEWIDGQIALADHRFLNGELSAQDRDRFIAQMEELRSNKWGAKHPGTRQPVKRDKFHRDYLSTHISPNAMPALRLQATVNSVLDDYCAPMGKAVAEYKIGLTPEAREMRRDKAAQLFMELMLYKVAR